VSVIFLLLPVALLLVGTFVCLFVWAARNGQFDDVRTPAVRVLLDDEPPTTAQRQAPTRAAPPEVLG
jgi:cbb3-type cytochrome oxidase maturation protein